MVENPATSSPGLAFLLTTIAAFGESGDYTYLNFWKDLRANDVLVVDGWETAYNEKFSAGPGKGERPLVVSYATSPAAEVYFASPQPADSPTGNILPPGESFRQVEFVGILKGATKRRSGAPMGGLHAGPDLPGRHPAADVGLSGPQRHGAARRVHQICAGAQPAGAR